MLFYADHHVPLRQLNSFRQSGCAGGTQYYSNIIVDWLSRALEFICGIHFKWFYKLIEFISEADDSFDKRVVV